MFAPWLANSAPSLLLLHGALGGWDELVILAAGVLLAVVVVKMTKRAPVAQSDDELDDRAEASPSTDERR